MRYLDASEFDTTHHVHRLRTSSCKGTHARRGLGADEKLCAKAKGTSKKSECPPHRPPALIDPHPDLLPSLRGVALRPRPSRLGPKLPAPAPWQGPATPITRQRCVRDHPRAESCLALHALVSSSGREGAWVCQLPSRPSSRLGRGVREEASLPLRHLDATAAHESLCSIHVQRWPSLRRRTRLATIGVIGL